MKSDRLCFEMENAIPRSGLVDKTGKQLSAPPSEKPLDVAIRALVQAELADAKQSLHLANEADTKRLAHEYSKKWKIAAAVATLLFIADLGWNIFSWFVAPDMVKDWIKTEVAQRLVEPTLRQVADGVISSTMGKYVEKRLEPLASKTDAAEVAIARVR